ncbi:DUF2283 domain-containing protein [Hazenella sp. IB182353]|uniref:DUF2283 domain-containing protein n=1 Tax=Polycladospora coralii TaxID=2771432 RepID=UPI001746D769|nr:DUF2283 domain-containing protein [Polycladospora coralii]MBS7530813.1 DUF2283 domain-containing protein [Polycladospora coralii]
MRKSILTYDPQVNMGYLYLISKRVPHGHCRELDEDSELILDFDKNNKLIGVEFFPNNSHKIRELIRGNKQFDKKYKNENMYYVLQLSKGDAKVTLQLEEQDIHFIFGNEQLDDLLAIEIYATEDYDELFLTGDKTVR